MGKDSISLERISIEVSNRCRKGCSFCYNSSSHDGETRWTVEEIETFARSCARGGVKALSLGGGEPLEFPGIFQILHKLDGLLFRSLTTSGLPLDSRTYDQLRAARPDKVHVSITSITKEPGTSASFDFLRALHDRDSQTSDSF